MKYDLEQVIAGTCVHIKRNGGCNRGYDPAELADIDTGLIPCKIMGVEQLPPCPVRRFRTDEQVQTVLHRLIRLIDYSIAADVPKPPRRHIYSKGDTGAN